MARASRTTPPRMLGVAIALAVASCGELVAPPVTAVAVAPASAHLIPGETAQLVAELRVDGDVVVTDRAVTWATSDPGVATVSATGLVVAVAPGAAATITATSEGQAGVATVVVTGPVATVTVGPALAPVIVGASAQLTAELRDAAGALVLGRPITWAASDPAIAAVAADGVMTAQAVGGPVTITATADGHRGEVSVTTVAGIITGIADIRGFLEGCPTSDPAFATIQADFQLRENGVRLTAPIACREPFSAVPIAELTDELIAYQVLRIAYYMSRGTEGRLPWTTRALYDWMKASIGGINLKTAPGQLYCCDLIDGERYFSMSRLDDFQRNQKRAWPGLASSLDFFLHEIRHTDGPGHVTGCPAFPAPTDPPGCDATYDLAYLGSYGVQYWLNAGWATGSLHIGLGCAPPATATPYLAAHVAAANDFRTRFVTGAPPAVTAALHYGGPCP
ncbi:MAG: Ig domain-containing protein [Myxococcales bacterium]|nr:Ig domain-containing protein [Myxococcales bacterium]